MAMDVDRADLINIANVRHRSLWFQNPPGLSTQGGGAGDINDAGLIVGSGYLPLEGLYQATLWLGPTPIGLGFLDGYGGIYDSFAYAVNNAGLIAIGTWESGEAPAGVLVPKDTNNDLVPDTWFEDADKDGYNDQRNLTRLRGHSCDTTVGGFGLELGSYSSPWRRQ